jgi:AraC-like DNA-binding protein
VLRTDCSAIAALYVDEFDKDAPLVAMPRPEIHIVVRFGPTACNGLDIHAFGIRHRAHRKWIRAGQRTITARLRLGASDAVLGIAASAIAGRIVALEELWPDAARLVDALAAAPESGAAARILERAIADRTAAAPPHAALARVAAERLESNSVRDVAADLGVSERQLRRIFHDVVGASPKAFAKLARFHRALGAARTGSSWASIAVATGYYDQAHLIDEFRTIAGATPRALLAELARP